MEIRSVTLFIEPDFSPSRAASFFEAARPAFPVTVQTTRVATTPFPNWWSPSDDPATQTKSIGEHWLAYGADYVSLGPVQLQHDADWLEILPAMIQASNVIFLSIEIADQTGRIDPVRCLAAADIIRQLSTILPDGFANLYLAAIANCPPGSPFFPVAYHGGGQACFAIATQSADLARRAIQSSTSLTDARQVLVQSIEENANLLVTAAEKLAREHDIPFQGIDFSLAPYPTSEYSLAGSMEDLGLGPIGTPGSLFAAAFITECIDRADFPRCGFSGLMLPVLEDKVLAEKAAKGELSISDLLNYAAVCGVGLDTIPLPGDIRRSSLAGVLLDVAALATRLDKPLTARLMPLPGKAAGDPITFDFPYFADSAVMTLPDVEIPDMLENDYPLVILPRGNERLLSGG